MLMRTLTLRRRAISDPLHSPRHHGADAEEEEGDAGPASSTLPSIPETEALITWTDAVDVRPTSPENAIFASPPRSDSTLLPEVAP
jgi:hypothetical protein